MKAKSIRLNVNLRDSIISKIREAYIKKNPAPVFLNKSELMRLFAQEVAGYYRELSDTLVETAAEAGIPPKELISSTGFSIYTDGSHIQSHIAEEKEKGKRNYFYGSNIKNIETTAIKDSVIKRAFAAHKKRVKDNKGPVELKRQWQRELDLYMQDVRNAVYGVNTTGQLLEQWAEVEPYLPIGAVDPSRIQLPAVSFAALNSKL